MSSIKSLNDLFKETYASKMAHMIPSNIKFTINYETCLLSTLEYYKDSDEEAAKWYAIRTSKLGKLLSGEG